jgi:outer membrane biosynthesis protein TonB
MDNLFLILLLVSLVCLVVGLIKPSIFSRLLKGQSSRKKTSLIFSISSVLFFILFGIAANTDSTTESPTVTNTVQPDTRQLPAKEELKQVETVEAETAATPEPTPSPILTPVVPENPKPTPTPTPTPVQSETVSQKNAVKKAKSYLGYTAFSHDGLVAQLEYDQFSHADAVYGADNYGANWNEQAAKKAKAYMEYSAFSRGSLIAQLEYDKFTQAQAEYGANAVGL